MRKKKKTGLEVKRISWMKIQTGCVQHKSDSKFKQDMTKVYHKIAWMPDWWRVCYFKRYKLFQERKQLNGLPLCRMSLLTITALAANWRVRLHTAGQIQAQILCRRTGFLWICKNRWGEGVWVIHGTKLFPGDRPFPADQRCKGNTAAPKITKFIMTGVRQNGRICRKC